jgi:hypothetical protein
MLPLKPYLHMYKKYGLIPQTQEQPPVPYTVQTFAIYTLLVPLLRKKAECTTLTVRRKHGIFSMNIKGTRNSQK